MTWWEKSKPQSFGEGRGRAKSPLAWGFRARTLLRRRCLERGSGGKGLASGAAFLAPRLGASMSRRLPWKYLAPRKKEPGRPGVCGKGNMGSASPCLMSCIRHHLVEHRIPNF